MVKKRILLVEDDAWWQRFVVLSLEGLSEIDLVIASDYGEGIRALQEGPYDLLIFDNTLKEIRGASIELLQAAHRLLHPMPPAFVHSADLMPKVEEQVTMLGAEYFRKQESQQEFKNTVQRLLTNSV